MANSGPNTNGSQFFITYAKQPHLNGLYTVFGKVIHGFEVLDLMEKVMSLLVLAYSVLLNINVLKFSLHLELIMVLCYLGIGIIFSLIIDYLFHFELFTF